MIIHFFNYLYLLFLYDNIDTSRHVALIFLEGGGFQIFNINIFIHD